MTINFLSFARCAEIIIQFEAKYNNFSRMQLVLVLVFLTTPCLSRKPNPEGEKCKLL